jgi:hypothetical protein
MTMPHGTRYQLRCKACKAYLPAMVFAGYLWIEDVVLDGAILVCRCGRRCAWWTKLPASQAALKAAQTTGAVEA